MAKRRKAKAKRTKTAKTKKAKTATKIAKRSKAKKSTRPIRTGASGTDPCAAQQQSVDAAQVVVDDLTNEIDDPGIPPAVRVRAEKQLRAANMRLATAQRALDRCRLQNP